MSRQELELPGRKCDANSQNCKAQETKVPQKAQAYASLAAHDKIADAQSPCFAQRFFHVGYHAHRSLLVYLERDNRLGATDYLLMPDYPITAEKRAQVEAYRQALRDLPAQEGAPWDGGGELTPWPTL